MTYHGIWNINNELAFLFYSVVSIYPLAYFDELMKLKYLQLNIYYVPNPVLGIL